MSHQLPIVGQPQPERADAARNRQKIIQVAARMIELKGADQLSLDEVAREACVGVGTVYRRFGDRTGLVFALIDERERVFQEAFMNGPPPLGPGAGAAERVAAFLTALVDRVVDQQDLMLLLELGSPKVRFRGPYRLYHTHLTRLLAEVRPAVDPRFLADALLAPLNAHLISYQRDERGLTVEAIKAGARTLAQALTQPRA
ncbi:TetR/AcrR family transcriptional regulator [Nonomuraea glycinis]|uniref:TetR/AcrR family transcriptional regulator n=1 Tax=Nonomuraea glycinis TaxID=2047744 RepID=UPI001CDA31AE|nr:TetR/AcrR family transcriptional regulator [Nonomuraea glycinis]MCA2180663.1 TetR/AcrR family transcriptional regulator [Nonomuraea glycinis]